MATPSDMSLFGDVLDLESFQGVDTDPPPKDKLSVSPTPSTSKLSFAEMNQSIKEGVPTFFLPVKRKFDWTNIKFTTPKKKARTESPLASDLRASRFEARQLKIDLIAAKAQITKLEVKVLREQTTLKEKEILFEKEKELLLEQHQRDERAVSDMNDRLEFIRRREDHLKEDFEEARIEHVHDKAKWDSVKLNLQRQVADLKDQLLESNVSCQNQVAEMKMDMNELQQGLEGAQLEVEMLKKEVAKQTSRAQQVTSFRTQLEKQNLELQEAYNKLGELQYVKDSYEAWQQQSKTAQKRLCNMEVLEKEVVRLRATERNLRDLVCNKLLLEEQAATLQAKLDALQPLQQELHDARVKLASLESSLEAWASVAWTLDASSPAELSAAVEAALQRELAARTDCSNAASKLAQIQEEIATAKFERDKVTSKLNDLLTKNKSQESLLHRLQKRLLLVTRERDSYRQQVECYEKELTVTLSGEAGAGGAALLTGRVKQLEHALQGYRDFVATHDQTNQASLIESLRAEVTRHREAAESAARDVARLKAQRDHMQMQIERIQVPQSTGWLQKSLER